ncbi:DUF721 domain-containing protein [Dichotomicrobium thermohalophilum]|uniref:DUF721 domain-containing protein n=1 Tax=Dichotomicrobium thermohalophilum TaxID=933063 RepID=A0A397QA71_9HYPH|nr:DciA family protein [Dichotomicrobium thermohalophilum]RIA56407.1 hypothetical protein BXY53_1513 [Dichotomicrobium thermohalophilum]
MAQTTADTATKRRGKRAPSPNFTPDSRVGYSAPKPAGAFTPSLTRPAFEKYGFPAAALLTDWAGIAGPELASYTAPERLKWPRQPEAPEEARGQSAATLVLRVEGPRAIELQHRLPQLIERINSYFGFRAVAQIRLYQAPLDHPRESQLPPPKIAPRPDRRGLVKRIQNPRLRTALSRIAAAIDA